MFRTQSHKLLNFVNIHMKLCLLLCLAIYCEHCISAVCNVFHQRSSCTSTVSSFQVLLPFDGKETQQFYGVTKKWQLDLLNKLYRAKAFSEKCFLPVSVSDPDSLKIQCGNFSQTNCFTSVGVSVCVCVCMQRQRKTALVSAESTYHFQFFNLKPKTSGHVISFYF